LQPENISVLNCYTLENASLSCNFICNWKKSTSVTTSFATGKNQPQLQLKKYLHSTCKLENISVAAPLATRLATGKSVTTSLATWKKYKLRPHLQLGKNLVATTLATEKISVATPLAIFKKYHLQLCLQLRETQLQSDLQLEKS
jgi:hypothetical protein